MHTEQSESCGKSISWKAILAGALVALGLTFLFNLLTLAIGLSLFTHDESGKMILTYVGFAWILVGIYIILFVSGWVTGRIVNTRYSLHCANGCLHGFLAWTLYLIISIFLLSHVASDSAAVLLRTTVVNTAGNTYDAIAATTSNTSSTANVATTASKTAETEMLIEAAL